MSSNNFQRFLDSVAPEDGSYRAWLKCQQGDTSNLKLVPASHTGEATRYVPYLQPITIEYSPDTGLLCLICHGTAMMVFLEGRRLEELADLIAERRVKSIHVYDPATHTTPPENDVPVITKITVEQS